jgi:hypothetical protein
MKRGLLFGLGSFLIVGVIAGLAELLRQEKHVDFIVGAVMALIWIPLNTR